MQTTAPVRQRLTPAQRDKILAAYRRSRLSQREFPSRRESVCPQVPNLLSPVPAAAVYRLHLAGGVILEMGSGFQAQELAALLQLLRAG